MFSSIKNQLMVPTVYLFRENAGKLTREHQAGVFQAPRRITVLWVALHSKAHAISHMFTTHPADQGWIKFIETL